MIDSLIIPSLNSLVIGKRCNDFTEAIRERYV
nr:MAG TPA: hypothetical protein [Caudoviricetes sp.]DAN56299.1 MAG TPA: hypothetical protein [Caudoviricetes sp.]DAR91034.1 MAG TPA: hypothetical protein [Caudoviricetes sp.]DAS25508.1 MAG TPA: hypothetical protein [Bacteriophage sp.]